MKKVVIAILIILMAACSPSASLPTPTPTDTQVLPSATPTRTATPVPSPTPTFTATPSPTPTFVPISTEEEELILQAYKVMLFIQLESSMLEQTAEKVKAGELVGFESFGTLIALAAVANAVEEAIPQTTLPDHFSPHWDQAILVHTAIKDLIARWFNDEIDSTIVLEEVGPYLVQIEKIMGNLDKDLATNYGFDVQLMTKAREDAMQSMNSIFGTPTPTP